MAKKQELITKIAGLLKIEPAKLQELATAADDADVAIEIPEGLTVLTPQELEARDTNNLAKGKADAKKGYIDEGREKAIKDLKAMVGLDYVGEGSTDPKKFIEEYQKLTKSEPNAQLQEKLRQIEALQADKEKLAAEKLQLEQKAEQAAFDAQLLQYFPTNLKSAEEGGLSQQEYLHLAKMSHTFEKQGDGTYKVLRDGKELRDSATQNLLQPKDVISTFFTERKWTAEATPPAGRGAGSDNGKGGGGTGKYSKMSDIEKAYKEATGQEPMGSDFQAFAAQNRAENFDANS